MKLTKRQFGICGWTGFIFGILVLAGLITVGSFRATSINRASHQKWHASTGKFISFDPYYGVSYPKVRTAHVELIEGDHDVQASFPPKSGWSVGDTFKIWYADDTSTFIPAAAITQGSSPYPLVGGTVVGFTALGLFAGLVVGLLIGFGIGGVFKTHNRTISNAPLKPNVVW